MAGMLPRTQQMKENWPKIIRMNFKRKQCNP
jgi:hypothetical protein